MGKPNFSDEFKRDTVAQITERGYPVAEVSQRLGISPHSLLCLEAAADQASVGRCRQGCRDPPVEARTGPGDRRGSTAEQCLPKSKPIPPPKVSSSPREGVETGYSLFVKSGHVQYTNYDFGSRLLSLTDAKKLPAGKSAIKLRWHQKDRKHGEIVLIVNGREAACGEMAPTVVGAHGSNELFNIGRDTGAAASNAYDVPFVFTGTIIKVTAEVGQSGD